GHVHDIGQLSGRYFFAMEYLHGRDVRELMMRVTERGERIPIGHALTIVTNVAAALQYAHELRDERGELLRVVHRDVSLANIFVTYDGGIKLVDFGIARATTRSMRTQTGTVRGKLAYMSPEQCLGKPVDSRSDIFSLGIVLWELITSQRLFRAEHGEADYMVMDRIVKCVIPSPSTLVDDLPPELEAITMRALSADPDDRYSSARAFLLAVEAAAAQLGLRLSPSDLSGYLAELFGRPPEPWLGDSQPSAGSPSSTRSPGSAAGAHSDRRGSAHADDELEEETDRRLALPLPAGQAPMSTSSAGELVAAPRSPTDRTLPPAPSPAQWESDMVSIEMVPPRAPGWRRTALVFLGVAVAAALVALAALWL
ncbi:MAG: serine/threonine-protein kinase, partial [Myxococcota bacterium]